MVRLMGSLLGAVLWGMALAGALIGLFHAGVIPDYPQAEAAKSLLVTGISGGMIFIATVFASGMTILLFSSRGKKHILNGLLSTAESVAAVSMFIVGLVIFAVMNISAFAFSASLEVLFGWQQSFWFAILGFIILFLVKAIGPILISVAAGYGAYYGWGWHPLLCIALSLAAGVFGWLLTKRNRFAFAAHRSS